MILRILFKWCIVALLVFCAAFPAAAQTDEKPRASLHDSRLEGLPIAEIKVEGLHHISLSRVLGLFPCKVGDRFTNSCIETAKRYLEEWHVFDSIKFSEVSATDGVHILLVVRESLLVGTIDLTGNYPFLEQRLSKRISLRPGSTFTKEDGEAQTKKLELIFTRAGYESPLAELSTTYNMEQNDLQLTYHIHKGRRITLGTLAVVGNKAIPYGRFLSVFSPFKTYSVTHRRDAIHKLVDLYRSKGYLRARVKVVEEVFDKNTAKMNVTVKVNEGPHVVVHIVGNRGVSNASLKRVMTLRADGSYDEATLEDSTNNILKLYNSRGYDQATVTTDKKEVKSGEIVVTFDIHEGPKSIVYAVNFSGNGKISGGKLRKQILTRPLSLFSQGDLDFHKTRIDRLVMLNYYKSLGFETIEIAPPDVIAVPNERHQFNVNFDITEGPQTIVKQVDVVGVDEKLIDPMLKLLSNKAGQPFNPFVMEVDSNLVLEFLKDNGYPYATVVESDRISVDGEHVIVRYTVNPGVLVKIGEVLLVGNTLTSQHAVRGSMEIKNGQIYSAQKIIDSEFALRRLGVFQNVRIEQMGLADKSSLVHLVVRMEERRPLVVDLGFGFQTDDLYTGSLTFTNFNAFGWAKRIGLRLVGGQRLSRGEITWTDPRFFNSDLQWTVNGLVQYVRLPFFDFIQPSGGTSFFRRFHRTSFMARYQMDDNYFLSGDSSQASVSGVRNNLLSKISFSTTYDRRNNFGNPTKGFYLMGAVDLVNEIKGQQANFFKFRAGLGHYAEVFDYFIITNDLRFNRIETIGSNVSVPGNERFFLGGDTTIRGFSLFAIGPRSSTGVPLGGNLSWIHNIEIKGRMTDSLQWAVFHDMGSLSDTWSQINLSTFKQSIGPGLRIMTPVGPVKLDYGFVIDRQPGEDFGRFHFLFGNVF
ncbi:MAG: outer membrane protein assembly factor BamA [Deltaproteobacteria bacterium CG11_big_fil_rev_8_21_14_0_20_47_16]|nr:MAG: outer membrane protein assembly factor BamA [Deltaproteobacteria bacterium CG11_big_fil_rev_8_21_14_0_20_47_16]